MEPLDIIENKPAKSMASNAVNYAAFVGLAMIVYGVILYAFNLSMDKTLSFLVFIFMITGMYIGTKKYKITYTEGYLSYGKSFKSSFLIGLFASLILMIWSFIFFKFIASDIVTQIVEKAQASMLEKNPNMTEEEMQIGLKWVKAFTTPVMMAVMGTLYNIFFSTIFALIVAAFVKKDEPMSI